MWDRFKSVKNISQERGKCKVTQDYGSSSACVFQWNMESGWNRIQAVEVKTVKIVSGYTTIDQSGNEDILCELSWASSLQIKVFTESREKRKIYFEGCNRLAFQLKLIISSEQQARNRKNKKDVEGDVTVVEDGRGDFPSSLSAAANYCMT